MEETIPQTTRRALIRASCVQICNTIFSVLEEPFKVNPSLKLNSSTASSSSSSSSTAVEQRMRLPAATAMVLLNRFYSRHSFARHDRFLVATACAFLGFKVEEMHQKVRHVINCSWDVFHRGLKPRLEPQSAAFAELRANVLETERCILYTLEFDVAVEHPFPHIKQRILDWRDGGVFRSLGFVGGKSLREVTPEISSAMSLANSLAFSSLGNGISLHYSPQMVAMACLFMSFQLSFSARGLTNPVTMQLLRKSIEANSTTAGGGGGGSSGAHDTLNARDDLLQIQNICSRICYHLADDALGDLGVRTTYVESQNKTHSEQGEGGSGNGGENVKKDGRDADSNSSNLNKEYELGSSASSARGGHHHHHQQQQRPHQSALAYALSVLEASEETDATIDIDEPDDILGPSADQGRNSSDGVGGSDALADNTGDAAAEEEDDIIALPML